MRLLILTFIAMSVMAQIPGSNQPTQIRPTQIKEPAVAKASIRIVMPTGAVIYAQLDPTQFTIDQTVSPPVLRIAVAQFVSVERYYLKYFTLSRNGDGTVTLPTGTLSAVYRNGLFLTEAKDYTISGGKLTFLNACCEADETLSCSVWQTSPTAVVTGN